MRTTLGIFARAPVAGFVKTRLTPPLTPAEAAAVYAASLTDVIARSARELADVVLFFDDANGAEDYFATAHPGLERAPQTGADLGERLASAFRHLFERGAGRALVIGSDAPTLPRAILTSAAAALDAADAVLGPTLDGGYYLVGMTRRAWPGAAVLFEGIAWSTERVLMETQARARAAGLAIELLEEWYDIDRVQDLERARQHAGPDSALGRLLARWAAIPGGG